MNNSINQTGCHHGNSNKLCKPDPQPDKGNDCTNPSGGNQDHCLSTSSTQPTPTTTTTTTQDPIPTTTTTVSTPITTTTLGQEQPVSTTTLPRVCAAVEMCPPTSRQCETPAGFPFVTSLNECPPPLTTETVSSTPKDVNVPGGELAYTGAAPGGLAAVGLVLALLGAAIRRLARG